MHLNFLIFQLYIHSSSPPQRKREDKINLEFELDKLEKGWKPIWIWILVLGMQPRQIGSNRESSRGITPISQV